MAVIVNNVANRMGLNPKEFKRFVKFAVVGVIGAVVDFSSGNFMKFGLGIDSTTASTVAFILAVMSNFLWNRYWTYPDSRSKSLVNQFLSFGIVNATGLLIRWPIVKFGESPLANLIAQPNWFSDEIIALLAFNGIVAFSVGIVMFWNFFVNRYWTYNDVE